MTTPATRSTTHTAPEECSPADRVTKSLLGYGVIAGPFYWSCRSPRRSPGRVST